MSYTPKFRQTRISVLAKGNGWYSAKLLDCFGGMIKDCGDHKGKENARRQARLAADEYNATFEPPKFLTEPNKPVCVPAGESGEMFGRRRV